MTPLTPASSVVATLAATPDGAPVGIPPDALTDHPAQRTWQTVVQRMEQAMVARQAGAGRTVVLVPYAQLMNAGRRAWARAHPSGFPPRFESTRNWASSLQPFLPGPTDLSMDAARDSLVAAAFIDRVAAGRLDAALRSVMVARLVEGARQLAPLAAAVHPDQRLPWADARREALAQGNVQSLLWEALLASLALAWVSTSSYATDVLWGPQAQPGDVADTLLVLQGFQQDPLATALAAHWGERAAVLDWYDSDAPQAVSAAPRLHACGDAEDEAQRAAACVLTHANAGRVPVALVANDRLLTRRVSAMLEGAGLTVRDETGWKLSTTRAAARLMSLLRAADGRARMDDVLDLLKQAGAWPEAQVLALEHLARDAQVSLWRSAVESPRLAAALPDGLATVLAGLQPARPLVRWLQDLRDALVAVGLWDTLTEDPAGQQLLAALRLVDGAVHELASVTDALLNQDTATQRTARTGERPGGRLSLSAFTAWVRDVLEGVSFMPFSAGPAGVVILPMAQLLGRHFAATVVPGCDEVHLNPSPEPPGQWTPAQREALGLPAREVLAHSAAQAWQTTLTLPQLDVLWRTQERGEVLLPSASVQALLPPGTEAQASGATDPRAARVLHAQPQQPPEPSAGDVLPESLSASAYQDLRDCPYRFFALRQLRLVDAAELEAEPDQRDMGNWLHAVLRAFHEQRGDTRPGRAVDRAELDRLGNATADAMGLNAGEGGAGFLPYQAVWPALRDGYLDWLAGFEATEGRAGPRFEQAEATLTSQAGAWKLYGKLDRIDQQDSPEGVIPFVIDYKTEGRPKTMERVKEPLEDTQLAFYAALLPSENVRAAYLSITDKRSDNGKDPATVLVEQPDVLMAREQLVAGLAHDMARVAAGHAMPALGEGRVCEFCAARGLCRKDFWSTGR
ncbi:MAG: PD-(D/E)XK nuclease family protein [Hydrogenophaga sp.]|uniref:PD-(D/E)XK nuclease family protein n=1 Tax=Hydrogenophaga sp. TaxID=1904254 RepID=UPI002720DB4C|nr:PD-(D/E)XK nuclease family protein [Hydrogenophaga sp.]MDO9148091.1 PD-(D/E)XK nuclease family protein [Hydrogenophaga sp.]MDO9603715.1 PD-(D/E)XK nuclease family protein [Hydrogenophaga sp.]